MWKELIGDAIGMVCLVAICVGTYYIAWACQVPDLHFDEIKEGFLTPPLNH